MSSYEITAIKMLHEGWGKLLKLEIRLPDGATITREVEDHGAAVCVLPYDPERRTAILVRQFRAAVFQADGTTDMLEAPAGMLDEDDPEACARREALEEVGLELPELEPLGAVWTMPGVSTECMHLFLAPYARQNRVARGGGLEEEHEDITVLELPLAELFAMAERGSLTDLKTLVLVQALRLQHPELADAGPSAS